MTQRGRPTFKALAALTLANPLLGTARARQLAQNGAAFHICETKNWGPMQEYAVTKWLCHQTLSRDFSSNLAQQPLLSEIPPQLGPGRLVCHKHGGNQAPSSAHAAR